MSALGALVSAALDWLRRGVTSVFRKIGRLFGRREEGTLLAEPTPGPTANPTVEPRPGSAPTSGEPSQTPVAPLVSTPTDKTSTAVYYTKASIVLNKAPDPYNPDRGHNTTFAMAAAKDPVFDLGIKGIQLVGALTGVGVLLSVFKGILDLLPQPKSHGGHDDLTPLQRKRFALLLRLNTTRFSTRYLYPDPKTESSPESQFRAALIDEAISQESLRISRTDDEPMLPEVVMQFLFEKGLFPPPLEPLPKTYTEQRARYANNLNLMGFPSAFSRFSKKLSSAQQDRVYEAFVKEYEQDAEMYRSALSVLGVEIPKDLIILGQQTGMMPRLGSLANPQPTDRYGGL